MSRAAVRTLLLSRSARSLVILGTPASSPSCKQKSNFATNLNEFIKEIVKNDERNLKNISYRSRSAHFGFGLKSRGKIHRRVLIHRQ